MCARRIRCGGEEMTIDNEDYFYEARSFKDRAKKIIPRKSSECFERTGIYKAELREQGNCIQKDWEALSLGYFQKREERNRCNYCPLGCKTAQIIAII